MAIDHRFTSQQPRSYKPRKRVSTFGSLRPKGPPKVYKPVAADVHEDIGLTGSPGSYSSDIPNSNDY
jgi:hypothetical protein